MINAHTTSRTPPASDISLGSLTLPASEDGDFVESILRYILMVMFVALNEVCGLYGFFVYHILSYSFGSFSVIVYMVVCFVCFCLIL